MTSKENVHGHERAEIEPNHNEAGHYVYQRIRIYNELRFGDSESIIDKRTREGENSTNVMPEIVNTLQLHNGQRRSRRLSARSLTNSVCHN